MRTYHGERTAQGCEVTVDGRPLRVRSDLSGNAIPEFDWGYRGGEQLSMALLADFFGSDRKAEAMCETFERHVVAELPVSARTLTDYALTVAMARLVGVDGARADDPAPDDGRGAALADTPVAGTGLGWLVRSGVDRDGVQK